MKQKNIMVSFTDPKEIGFDGWNSKTYLAKDKLNRDIVIKEIERKEDWNLEDYYEEAKLINEMKHPNVVEIIVAGEILEIIENDKYCRVEQVLLAMPYYKNGSLKEYMKKNTLTIDEKNNIMLGILHGLESIHRKRLLHLDLKPDNILISDDGDAIISDFGISVYLKKLKDFIKLKNHKKGVSPYLITPEMFIDKKPFLSRKTDIYQIGLLMYSLYSNKSLEEIAGFTKEDLLNRKDDLINDYKDKVIEGSIITENDNIPENIMKIIKKCLNVDHKKRYLVVSEIHTDFLKQKQ